MSDLENTLYLDVANAKGEPKGRVTIALRPDLAPNHVARIKELARAGLEFDRPSHGTPSA